MPREIASASQVYAPGQYGPFSLDSFTRDDADKIEVSATIESWPDVPFVAQITVALEDGSGFSVRVPGRPKNRDGTDQTTFRCSIGIPVERNRLTPGEQRKRDVRSAQAEVEVFESIRTALTVRAV
jgi:hypothetical protein